MFHCFCGFLRIFDFFDLHLFLDRKRVTPRNPAPGATIPSNASERDCGLNPDHAIGVIIKTCRQRFLTLQIYTNQARHFYFSKICGQLGAPYYFVLHLPPDSLIIVGLDLVLTTCNITRLFRLFEESKQYVVATYSIVF